VMVARARSWPDFVSGRTGVMSENIIETRPAKRSVTASGLLS
jgi:hypothetical protein